MDPTRMPQVGYSDVYYVIDGTQIISGTQITDGTQTISGTQFIEGAHIIDGSQFPEGAQIIGYIPQDTGIVNDGQDNDPTQNYLFSTNSIGASGINGIESASMGPSSNQLTTLNSYMPESDLNNLSYRSHGHSGLPDDGELQFDLPPEMVDQENFVFMQNLDLSNIDLDAIGLHGEGNFPGPDFGYNNSSQDSSLDIFNNVVNPNAVLQQANISYGAVPPITIRTKKIRKSRKKVINEEQVPVTISTTSNPPMEMLGISTTHTTHASNDTFEYNTSIPCISPMYQEDTLSSTSYSSPVSPSTSYCSPVSPSTSYCSPVSPSTSYSSPVSPSTSTSSYDSPSSPSTGSKPRRPRVDLATLTDEQRYRHIRDQNNESSRIYRKNKKLTLKETENEHLLQQERNTRLKEVYEALKHRKDTAHELMKGFIKDACKYKNM